MEVKKTARKGKYLDTLEKYDIYRVHKQNLHSSNVHTDNATPIFNTLYYYHKYITTCPRINQTI